MDRFYPGIVASTVHNISIAIASTYPPEVEGHAERILEQEHIQQSLHNVSVISERLQFFDTEHRLHQMHRRLGVPSQIETVKRELMGVFETFMRDLHKHLFLYVDPASAAFFNLKAREEFTERVWNRFPGARYDLEESLKCQALGRSTACVMHLCRALEFLVRGCWRALIKPNSTGTRKGGFGTYISETRQFMKDCKVKGPAAFGTDWASMEPYFDSMERYLAGLKEFRHGSMHPQLRYEPREAAEELKSIRHLMIHIASFTTQRGRFKP